MSRILQQDILIEYLEKHGGEKIDLSCEATQNFMKQYMKKIIDLVPDGIDLMRKNGVGDDPVFVFVAMAALGHTLKQIAEKEICTMEGASNEKDNRDNVSQFNRKLCH